MLGLLKEFQNEKICAAVTLNSIIFMKQSPAAVVDGALGSQHRVIYSVMSVPLRISPSCSSLLSGMPWQMTSLTDVQQDLGKL